MTATVLVTGAGGFLGNAVAQQLKRRGHAVRSLARQRYTALDEIGVVQVQGDLADPKAVGRAVAGSDAVIHVAAKPGIWGRYADYFQANVVGTDNVIEACLAQGVKKLVYTSSPSVVHSGGDLAGVDESVPYPAHYHAHYPKTKALAEQAVLRANSAELATVALRPHLIWGPGDNHLLPRIISRANSGRLRFVGGGRQLIDTTYIDNAAAAHLNALDALAPGAACAGRAYFISNGKPLPVRTIINGLLASAGIAPVEREISARAAYLIGAVLETIWGGLKLRGEPPMTRFLAEELALAHWFNIDAARRDLGYSPSISIQEGLRRLATASANPAPTAAANQ